MKTNLIKGLDQDKEREVKAAFIAALPYRKQMIKVLEDKVESARVSSCNKEVYYNSNWAYKQADQMGYERALREIISLLSEK